MEGPAIDISEDRAAAQLAGLRQRAGRYALPAELDRDDMSLAFQPTWATDPTLLVGGDGIFPRMGEDIEAAEHSVHINQFGYKPGVLGDDATDLLVEKAGQGVAVRLVVDDQGSMPFSLSKAMYDKLAAAGVPDRRQPGLPTRSDDMASSAGPPSGASTSAPSASRPPQGDHHRRPRRLRRRTGFQDHFETGEFHDLFVRMEGAVASQFQLVFLASFRYLGGPPVDDLDELFPEMAPTEDAVSAEVLHNAPGFRPISVAIMEIMDSARETLDIVNPYVADPPAVRRMIAAAERGVKVRLLVPGKPNNPMLMLAQRHHHPALIEAGVEIWEHPAMVHSKAFVRDGGRSARRNLQPRGVVAPALLRDQRAGPLARVGAPVQGRLLRSRHLGLPTWDAARGCRQPLPEPGGGGASPAAVAAPRRRLRRARRGRRHRLVARRCRVPSGTAPRATTVAASTTTVTSQRLKLMPSAMASRKPAAAGRRPPARSRWSRRARPSARLAECAHRLRRRRTHVAGCLEQLAVAIGRGAHDEHRRDRRAEDRAELHRGEG